LWKAIVDHKYDNCFSNIFCYEGRDNSPLWKGVLGAARAAKMRYSWKVGNGRKVRFWKDQWFGRCSLAIQFWGLYSIINEHGRNINEAWDGVNLKFTF
jgi:hypothetical protein